MMTIVMTMMTIAMTIITAIVTILMTMMRRYLKTDQPRFWSLREVFQLFEHNVSILWCYCQNHLADDNDDDDDVDDVDGDADFDESHDDEINDNGSDDDDDDNNHQVIECGKEVCQLGEIL